MEILTGVLPWVLPPVLGAIIGYVTNAIAIRMLFRPLTEKRVFGLRVPLTPGLIPRERGGLAESMARMVSTELLTEEAVRRQIHVPSFEASVRQNISAVTTELLDMRLGTIGASFGLAVEGEAEPGGSGLLGSIGTLLARAVSGFTRSPNFSSLVKELVRHLVGEFSDRPVASVLGSSRSVDSLVARMLGSLTSERGRGEIRERVVDWVRRQFKENTNLAQFFSGDDVESITQFVDSVYPSFVRFFIKWLRQEGTKRELSIRGRFLVQDIVDRLNGFQRFIITAANYQRTLDENMDGIIDDAVDSIEEAGLDSDTRRRVVDLIHRELGAARERGIADLARRHEEAVETTAGVLAERAVAVLDVPEFRQGLIEAVSGGSGEEERTVGELLDRLFGLEGRDPGDFVAGLLFSNGTGEGQSLLPEGNEAAPSDGSPIAGTIKGFFQVFVGKHREMRIGELLGMTGESKADFDAALTTMLISTVDSRVPEILESIDIHDLVVSKINGLNIEEVESLLLQVIAKHLRWINIFGAVLGGLIGFIQDGLRLLNLSG